jgi:hypothetical protein
MTLKEKFKKQLDTATPTLNRPIYQAEQCEKIADEFAIEFAEWCVKNELFYSIQYGRIKTLELLEIYKKQKGL